MSAVRHTRKNPCEVCGGYDEMPRGEGVRCAGSTDGDWCYCMREEYAGELQPTKNSAMTTYAHRLVGNCKCGKSHDGTPARASHKQASPPREIEKTYDYLDADGKLLHQTVRYEGKSFAQRRPDPDKPGEWIWSLKEIETVPYNLPRVLRARPGTVMVIVEGEKDADIGQSHADRLGVDMVFTTCAGGAGGWKPEYGNYFRHRQVAIIPDHETQDQKIRAVADWVDDIGASLAGKAANVRLIDVHGKAVEYEHFRCQMVALLLRVADLQRSQAEYQTSAKLRAIVAEALRDMRRWNAEPIDVRRPGKDLSDWLEGTQYRIRLLWAIFCESSPDLVSSMGAALGTKPLSGSGRIRAGDLIKKEFTPLQWLIDGILPEGLTLLAGRAKRGKSWLALQWALGIALGDRVLNTIDVEQAEVLYLALEDGERRLQERMETLLPDGTEPTGLMFWTQAKKINEGLIDELNSYLDDHPATRLVIIDTLAMVRGAQTGRETPFQQDYNTLASLRELAQERRMSIVVVHHMRQMPADDTDSWVDAISGTEGLIAVVDQIMGLFGKRDEPNSLLKMIGRDIPEQRLNVHFDPHSCHWQLLEDAAVVTGSVNDQVILRELAKHPDGIDAKTLIEVTGITSGTARPALLRLVKNGKARKVARGIYAINATLAGSPV